jgi:glucose-6-phosphate 1-epimerase
MSQSVAALNRTFGQTPRVRFVDSPLGGIIAEIDTASSRAAIALRGAQVLDWVPKGSAPVLWLAPGARLDTGKPVRGGIPICWPWFGPSSDPALPSHGFVRTRDWTVTDVTATPERVTLTFEFVATPATDPQWNAAALARLTVIIGRSLRLELDTQNTGRAPLLISEALHSYVHVGDIGAVEIEGLHGLTFVDQLAGGVQRCEQNSTVTIDAEIDRLYNDDGAVCTIADRALNRQIRIVKSGSATTVVWNPWAEKSVRLGDMGVDGFRRMVCVETANAGPVKMQIEPGQCHRLVADISVESL